MSFVANLRAMSPVRDPRTGTTGAASPSRFRQPGSDLAGPGARRSSKEFMGALRRASSPARDHSIKPFRLSLSPVRRL
jgi:hypothetical protein